jgi:hypothetical protein
MPQSPMRHPPTTDEAPVAEESNAEYFMMFCAHVCLQRYLIAVLCFTTLFYGSLYYVIFSRLQRDYWLLALCRDNAYVIARSRGITAFHKEFCFRSRLAV